MVDRKTSVDKTMLSFFQSLGCSLDESKLCAVLIEKVQASVVDLSRSTRIPRSTVYRLLETLKNCGLVLEIIEEHRRSYRLAKGDRIELLVKEKNEQAQKAAAYFPVVNKLLSQINSLMQSQTKVYFYQGREGIRQMVWNVLSAKSEFLGYTYILMEEFVGHDFMKSWREEFDKKKLSGRDIYCEIYLESVKRYNKKISLETAMPRWSSRFINSSSLDINHQTDIYDNVVGIYNWHEGEVFGVEIHNHKVARFQRQLFEIIWQMAIPEKL